MLDPTQMAVLRDVGFGGVEVDDDVSAWYIDKLVDLVLHDPMLTKIVGNRVILTEAGRALLLANPP